MHYKVWHNWKGVSDLGGSHIEASGHPESQQLKINFSYRFGNSQVKAAADEESKRLNGGTGGIGQ